jgi:peptidoglycan L-alanyl-D-glutamate endopeptidase CwlK
VAEKFRFSKRSSDHLKTLHPDLIKVARLALRQSRVDFTIISARRTLSEQKRLVAAGKSQTLRSRHLNGQALDFVPLDPTTGKGRFDRALAIEVAAAFMDAGTALDCPVKWGGMWTGFEDIPHIEMMKKAK